MHCEYFLPVCCLRVCWLNAFCAPFEVDHRISLLHSINVAVISTGNLSVRLVFLIYTPLSSDV